LQHTVDVDLDDPRYPSYVAGRRVAFAFTDWLIRRDDVADKRAALAAADDRITAWCRTTAEEQDLDASAMIEGARTSIADTLRQSG
jgi:hypothetical protein